MHGRHRGECGDTLMSFTYLFFHENSLKRACLAETVRGLCPDGRHRAGFPGRGLVLAGREAWSARYHSPASTLQPSQCWFHVYISGGSREHPGSGERVEAKGRIQELNKKGKKKFPLSFPFT